jgi:catechol 2,3-dioxygenase-like lactoylglutathione lyase family enzyme
MMSLLPRLFALFVSAAAMTSLYAQAPQTAEPAPAPARAPAATPAPAPAGDIVGVGNFSHIVEDFDRSLGFYRDVLGLEVTNSQPFGPNPALEKLGATPGGQSRFAALRVPGSNIGVEIIQYKDIARDAQHPRFYDPGAANLALRVRNLDALFEKIAAYPGVKVLTAGGKPVTITTPNGRIHAVFVQDPDGFVVELGEVSSPPTGADEGNILGASFEATVRDTAESVKFYNDLLGFNLRLGTAFNDNQEMASTAGAAGASFKQSSGRIPGTSVQMTLIEFKNIERKELSGRTQDPGTAILQLRVKDVHALAAKLKAAGVPIVTTGGEPVDVRPGLGIVLVREPSNMLLELIQAAPQ